MKERKEEKKVERKMYMELKKKGEREKKIIKIFIKIKSLN